MVSPRHLYYRLSSDAPRLSSLESAMSRLQQAESVSSPLRPLPREQTFEPPPILLARPPESNSNSRNSNSSSSNSGCSNSPLCRAQVLRVLSKPSTGC